MNIIVPIDFGNASFSAYCYANVLAHRLGARLKLVHVISSKLKINEFLDDVILEQMTIVSEARLKDLTQRYPKDNNIQLYDIPTNYDIAYGDPGPQILKMAKALKADYIVMGIREKLNFISRLTGTTATDVVNHAEIPVLLVHASSRFRLPRKIVFAFDQILDLEDGVESYMDFNKKIKANTDFITVDDDKYSDINDMVEEIVSELFDDDNPPFGFQIKRIKEKDPLPAIYDYCLFENADMLTMIHRKDSIWNLIMNQSKTIRTAYQFHLPLLIIPS